MEYVADELRQGEQNTLAEQFYGYSKNQITSLRGEQTTIKNTTKISQSQNTPSKQYFKDKDFNWNLKLHYFI